MFFPVSGVDVAPYVPVLIAASISFFSSMAGVSGAFLLLPFQMSVLGYVNTSVSSTNHLYNVVSIPSGVYRYMREGRMVWPLTMLIALGTLPGVLVGTWLRVVYMPGAREFKMFVALVLVYIAVKLLRDLAKGGKAAGVKASPTGVFAVALERFTVSELRYSFQGQSYACSPPQVFALCLIVGVIGGAYGIGGGAIIAPFLVTWFGLPVHTIAGAALMGTFLTSTVGVIFFTVLSRHFPGQSLSPDWALGALFGLGGLIGMYFGARCQKFVPAKYIKTLLVVIMLGTASKYILDYFRG